MSTFQNLSKPAAVFFDWDGTLVDSFRFLHTAHNHVRGVLGIAPFSLEVFAGYFGQPREKLYQELYGDHKEEAKTHFEAFVLAHHMKALKPVDGAGDLLETLYNMGVPCGVVSNKKPNLIAAEIESFGWGAYFKSVVGAAEAAADKPAADPLILGIQRAGLEAVALGDIWFVGDTDNDIACAQNAGCVAVLVEGVEVFDKMKSAYTIHLHKENCRDLNDFVLQYA